MANVTIKLTNPKAVLRKAEIEAAILAHVKRGGDIFRDAEADVREPADAYEPWARVGVTIAACNAAVVAYLSGGKLVPASALEWGVDEQGIFVACEVTDKPRKARAGKGE